MTPIIAKAVWAICAVAWYIIRYPHERRARKTAVSRSSRDGRELVLLSISLTGLGIVPVAYVATGFDGFADYPFSPMRAWLGTAVFGLALYLFHRTHRDLGRNWSVSLEVRDQHRLITEGVYRMVRHPMYTAFFLWAVAQALLLPNWIAGLSGLVGFGTLFLFRVFREERLMLETFGEEYRAYSARTKRLLPWIF
ncbi:protein-S-isoprenylcysteine O-methyltransferase [Microbaculum marinum]|uniref:Protein-S-isoprenylcysteine O-methyltransferase n=1 Tax=Microbaculum marinum TaxID=1764581 RepID=A0AAW9RRV6_9HYPH